MGHYITGLLLDGERKSIQPMAARLVEEPTETDAMRQRLQDCVSLSPWSDAELLRRLALKLERELPGIEVFVADDTGFAKKGEHSVGVARQYSGTLGRTDNCQVATSLHLAGEKGSACIGFRLYLGKEWWTDRKRCRKAGVPEDVEFKKKWEIVLDLIDAALAWKIDKRPVLADAGYGETPAFREGLTQRGLPYVVGIPGNHLVWPLAVYRIWRPYAPMVSASKQDLLVVDTPAGSAVELGYAQGGCDPGATIGSACRSSSTIN